MKTKLSVMVIVGVNPSEIKGSVTLWTGNRQLLAISCVNPSEIKGSVTLAVEPAFLAAAIGVNPSEIKGSVTQTAPAHGPGRGTVSILQKSRVQLHKDTELKTVLRVTCQSFRNQGFSYTFVGLPAKYDAWSCQSFRNQGFSYTKKKNRHY